MNKVIIIFAAFCVALAVAGPAQDERPDPYQFQYQAVGEDGGQSAQSEQGDGNGAIQGSYSFKLPDGRTRTVTYTADDTNGFQAQVQSNEPGLISSNPAAATYSVQ